MAKFEFISGYENCGLRLPERKTAESAGYDFEVAMDTIIPPWTEMYSHLFNEYEPQEKTLDELAKITKATGCKPTLVPTGIKCKLDSSTYLELSVRSSCPLKYWLIMGNSVGSFLIIY